MITTLLHDIKEHLEQLWKVSRFRFSDLKTSTQISLKFTLFTMLQVLLFSILANSIFFHNWYTRQQRQFSLETRPIMIQKMILGKNRWLETEIFKTTSPEVQILLESRRIKSIAKIDDMYFIYKRSWNNFLVSNVTSHVAFQKNLIWISLYLMLIFWVISYMISLFFVKNSLKKLTQLLWFLDHINIDNLHQKIHISGHPYDEINRVSKKFNDVLGKIHTQTLSLKDFVTNASHELKTPLMSMSTEIDYTNKTQQYEKWLNNLKQQLKGMNALLETLVAISKLETLACVKKESIDMSLLTQELIDDVQKMYKEKNITLTRHIEKNIVKKIHKESRNIIIKNILENAYKFTPPWWIIDITLHATKLMIKDSGKWIDSNDIDRIRERFWQADRSKTDTKSFGLWLYLTKLLVEKHWRTIAITSKVNKGTVCSINF